MRDNAVVGISGIACMQDLNMKLIEFKSLVAILNGYDQVAFDMATRSVYTSLSEQLKQQLQTKPTIGVMMELGMSRRRILTELDLAPVCRV